MVLGIRFPKQFEHSVMSATGAPSANPFSITSLNGTPYASGNLQSVIPVSPQRYSQVRKVVFHASVRWGSISPNARLRIVGMSTSSLSLIPDTFSIPPGSSVRINGSGTVFDVPAFSVNNLFSKAGSSATMPTGTDQITDPTTLLTLEFDRFLADSADFFNFWDAVTGDNVYCAFRIVVERTDGSDFGSTATVGTMADVGVTVVQAPGANNQSVTIVPLTVGYINGAQMPADYASAASRGRLFRYVASRWDNIVSAHILTYCFWTGNPTRTFNVGLHYVSSYEPYATTLLYEETASDNASARASGDATLFRSQDVKSFLLDNQDHHVLYDNQNANSIDQPCSWLEIIQEGYTLTECHHCGGNQYRVDTTPSGYGSPATPPFDPTWYQSFPDDRIIDQKLFLALRHLSVVIDTEIRLYIDNDFTSDVIALASPSMAAINPSLGSTPTATAGMKVLYQSSFSPNPINLAGQRKMIFGLVVGTAAGQDDLIGTAELIYMLSVPSSEIPEIGNVFPVGEFNPEGCASTAAGLGDPGVLVISNGSSIPKKFNPLANAVEDAGIPAPFCNEQLPSSVVDDTAASPAGGLQAGIYRYRYTFRNCCTGKESDPNGEDIVVDTSGASPAAQVTLNFTGVRIPGDPQICEICVYRTVVDGAFPVMAKVGCFDPDVQSTFVDTVSDEALDFAGDPLSTLNAPPPCTPIVVEFRNRLAFMGDIPDLSPAGTVTVVQGSDIVLGSADVEWDRCMEGKYIQLEGDCRPYEILCIMPPEDGTSPAIQRLQLVEPYEGSDQTGALYTICGHPNRVWFSEPFEPEYVPASSFMDVEPGDGDRIMGAVSNFDSLLICKRRKSYVLRWRDNPVLEVPCPARVSSDVGCIAPRSFAQVESGSVWLSDRGLAIYDGRSVSMIPESSDFDIFFTDPDNANYVRRDALGRVIGAVGVYYPKRKQYLLLLPTVQTERGANLLMVWDTHLRNVTVHKFCQEFLSMTVGKDSDGNERVYVGDTNGFVWILDIGHTDGVGTPGQTGTVQGTISAAGIDADLGVSFIEDENASFIQGGIPGLAGLSGVPGLSGAFDGSSLGLAGVCVFFRRAGAELDEEWESRYVFAAIATRLFVTPPLESGTDLTGYDYMLGPIDWRAEFKPTNYGDDDMLKRDWRQVVVHHPEEVSSLIRVQLIPDFQNSDPHEDEVVDELDVPGAGRTFNMNFARGRQIRPVERKLYNFEQVVMTNFAPNSPVRILNHLIAVAPHTSK